MKKMLEREFEGGAEGDRAESECKREGAHVLAM